MDLVQFVHPGGGEGIGQRGLIGDIVILASCVHHFTSVVGNLVQHPSNNISIVFPYPYSYLLIPVQLMNGKYLFCKYMNINNTPQKL